MDVRALDAWLLGRTALMLAARYWRINCLKELLERGADKAPGVQIDKLAGMLMLKLYSRPV